MSALDLSFYRGKRVFVTGDTGFKGSWLSYWLSLLGAHVTGYALAPESPRHHFSLLRLDRRIKHVTGDVRDAGKVARVIASARPEILFHFAAQPLVRRSYSDPKETFDVNVGGGVNVLEAVRRSSTLRSVVFITSDKCYLNKEWPWGYRETDELGGRDPYSASKAAVEDVFFAYARSYFDANRRLGAATVRAGNVIGGGDWSADRIVPDTMKALLAGRPVVVRQPQATRPWQHVLDPLSGYLELGRELYRNPALFAGAWNFGPDSTSIKTVRELVGTAIDNWGSGRMLVRSPKGAPHEATWLQLNCDKAAHKLGWRPRWNFARSLKETVLWYREVARDGRPASEITRAQIESYMGGPL